MIQCLSCNCLILTYLLTSMCVCYCRVSNRSGHNTNITTCTVFPRRCGYNSRAATNRGRCLIAEIRYLCMYCTNHQSTQTLRVFTPPFLHVHTQGARNKDAFPPDVVEAFKYTFSQPGAITPTINYHRSMFSYRKKTETPSKKTVQVPTLVIWGDDDFFLEKEMADAHSSLVDDITVRHIPNCSHWVQQDAPDLVNQYIKEFIESTN